MKPARPQLNEGTPLPHERAYVPRANDSAATNSQRRPADRASPADAWRGHAEMARPLRLTCSRAGLGNLNSYWRRWTARVRPVGVSIRGVPPRRLAASGALGVPRLHYTIGTGKVATKEAAARHALEVLEPRWHRLIEDAIAYWRGEPPSEPYRRHPHRRHREAVEFVACVIDAANSTHAHTQ